MITIDELVKDPRKVRRIGKSRRTLCQGGCGRLIWGDYCRKCERRRARSYHKEERRARRKKQ